MGILSPQPYQLFTAGKRCHGASSALYVYGQCAQDTVLVDGDHSSSRSQLRLVDEAYLDELKKQKTTKKDHRLNKLSLAQENVLCPVNRSVVEDPSFLSSLSFSLRRSKKELIFKNRIFRGSCKASIKKIAVWVLACALSISCGFFIGNYFMSSEYSMHESYTVERGDTLWDVAHKFNPEEPTRDTVARIASLNHLASATIKPGQKLEIPVDNSHIIAEK